MNAFRQRGYTLISSLVAMVVISAITLLLIGNSTSELMQSGNNYGLAGTRAAAEAAQAETAHYLVNDGLTDINSVLAGYVTRFATSSADAAVTPIVEANDHTTLINSLDALPRMRRTGTINTATYEARVDFTEVITDEASFSSAGQTYYFRYVATATAERRPYKRTVTTRGLLQVRLGRTYLNQYVLLADDGGGSSGNFFATGMNYDGPVHVNSNWRFAGAPQFQMGATTAASTVEMYRCSSRNYASVSVQATDCTRPDWGGRGLQYGASRVDLPQNSFSQQNAALGRGASVQSTPSRAQECAALGNAAPPGCSGSGASDGVYLPHDGANLTGGIYVKGNLNSAVLSEVNGAQVYDLTDSQNRRTQITVNYTARTTTVASLNAAGVVTSSRTYGGIPNGQLYSTGSILSLRGPARNGSIPSPAPDDRTPSQVLPALAAQSQLNIASNGDMVIQGDLTYKEDPRQVASAKNVLALISGTGNVRVGTSAPNDVYIHGAVLAGANNRGLSVDNYSSGPPRGSIRLLGSLAEDLDPPRGIGSIDANGNVNIVNGYGDGFHFDKRFLNGGSVPPFFPATTRFEAKSSWPDQQEWREGGS